MKRLLIAVLTFALCGYAFGASFSETKRAAEQGDASAQNNLGFMYANGEGVPQDDKTAVKWYRLAAEQGLAHAQFNLGNMYANGRGVPQDHKAAVKCYQRAAEQGDADAQFNLGVMFYNGEGVPQDDKAAYAWFIIAAAQGHSNATEARDLIAKELSPTDLSKAQDLSKKYYELYVEPFQ